MSGGRSDTRRVRDVRPRAPATLADFDGDPVLYALGYSGEAKMMQLRLARMRELEAEGRGPGATHRALLDRLGYRSRWRPYYPPGAERLPRVED